MRLSSVHRFLLSTMPFFQTAGRLKITSIFRSACPPISRSVNGSWSHYTVFKVQCPPHEKFALSLASSTIIPLPFPFVKPFFHSSAIFFLWLFFYMVIDFFNGFGLISGLNIFYILLDISVFCENNGFSHPGSSRRQAAAPAVDSYG